MKKLILFLIFTIFANATKVNIDLSHNIIQLGVFKDEKNINNLRKKFSDLKLYIKKYPNNLKKLFIVNIKDNELQKILKRVRKDIPKAFVLTKKKKNELFLTKEKGDWLNKSLDFEKKKSKLDSKAIIKTTNKFFE